VRAAGPLEKHGKTVAKVETANESQRRTDRLIARELGRQFSERKTIKHCGHPTGSGHVTIKAAMGPRGTDSVGLSGVQACGSVWVCPVCAAKIARHRTDELERGIKTWAKGGRKFVLATVTLRHKRKESLADLWDRLLRAWRRLQKSGTYRRWAHANGVVSFHRTVEITYGANGWHPHLHVLFFVDWQTELGLLAGEAGKKFIAMWQQAVENEDGETVAAAQDWKVLKGSAEALAGVAGYMNKGQYVEARQVHSAGSLALEVGRHDLKEARGGNRTPFQILGDIVAATADLDAKVSPKDVAVWIEYAKASAGRRQQLWGPGLRDLLALEAELSDEEAAAAVTEGEALVTVPDSEFMRLQRWPGVLGEVLSQAIGQASIEAAQAMVSLALSKYGIQHERIRIKSPEPVAT
jgi:hypothetical protein